MAHHELLLSREGDDNDDDEDVGCFINSTGRQQ